MRNDVVHDATALTDYVVRYRRLRLAYNLAHLRGRADIEETTQYESVEATLLLRGSCAPQ